MGRGQVPSVLIADPAHEAVQREQSIVRRADHELVNGVERTDHLDPGVGEAVDQFRLAMGRMNTDRLGGDVDPAQRIGKLDASKNPWILG